MTGLQGRSKSTIGEQCSRMGQKLKMRLGCWAGNQQHQGIGYLPDVRSIELQPWHETHVQSANMIQAAFTGFCPAAIIFRKLGLRPGNAFR